MTTWAPTVYPDELYHHGIKGQKWGVRRYQNPDGSLTPAGLARLGISPKKGYSSMTTSSYKKKYGNNDIRTKRSKELDKKITEKYQEDSLHKGRSIAKALIMNPDQELTYNMARSIGEGKVKSMLRAYFDLSVTTLFEFTAGSAIGEAAGKGAEKYTYATTKAAVPTKAMGTLTRIGVTSLATDAAGALARNSGTELSLQQRLIRDKYVKNKHKKR